MSFDWSEYIQVAQDLVGSSRHTASREARARAAISRAYYAAFCTARNLLRDVEGRDIPRSRAHRHVIDQFLLSRERARKRIGWNLDILRTARVRADYEDTMTDTVDLSDRAPKMIALARQVLSDLKHL